MNMEEGFQRLWFEPSSGGKVDLWLKAFYFWPHQNKKEEMSLKFSDYIFKSLRPSPSRGGDGKPRVFKSFCWGWARFRFGFKKDSRAAERDIVKVTKDVVQLFFAWYRKTFFKWSNLSLSSCSERGKCLESEDVAKVGMKLGKWSAKTKATHKLAKRYHPFMN